MAELLLETAKCKYYINDNKELEVRCGNTTDTLSIQETRLLHAIAELAEVEYEKGNVSKGDD